MPMTNYLAGVVLQAYFTNHYLGLHDNDPTTAGLASSEISGGSYARQRITWTAPSNRTVANTNQLVFYNLPACTISYFGIWELATGSNCVYSLALPTTLTVNYGGTFIVPVNDLAIQFQ